MRICIVLMFLSLTINCDGFGFYIKSGYLLVAGGKDRSSRLTDTKQFYSIKHNRWVTEDEIPKDDPGSIFTSKKGFMPVRNSGFYVFPESSHHKPMIAGGDLEETFIYDDTEYPPSWPVLPQNYGVELLRQRACGASLFGVAYLFGGVYSQREIAYFTSSNKHWLVVRNNRSLLPMDTEGCGAVGHEGKGVIYICGDSRFEHWNISDVRSRKCMSFDGNPKNPLVYDLNRMNYARTGNFLATYGDYIYAVGGNDEHGSAERLRAGRFDWYEIKSSMDIPRKFSLSLSDDIGNIYLIGGATVTYIGVYVLEHTVEKYCTRSKKWKKLSDIPEARIHSAGLYFSQRYIEYDERYIDSDFDEF